MMQYLQLRRFATLLLLLLYLVGSASFAAADDGYGGKVVTLFGVYPAREASFGDPIPDYGYLNLMLPPSECNQTLCYLPSGLLDLNGNNRLSLNLTDNKSSASMALMVRTGNCTAEQQTRNAMFLQKHYVPQLHYLIIQGPADIGNLLQTLNADSNLTSHDSATINSIGVMSTTFRAGEYLRQDVRNIAARTGYSPILFNPNSASWSMVGSIDPYWISGSGSGGSATDDFYWFRVLLFTLLIVSPCLRAAYLWWAGGGRVRFRRNDRGRITGLQYIPPTPYWLSMGLGSRPTANPHSEPPTTTLLTEDEFNCLPEIEYKPIDPTERNVDEEETGEFDPYMGRDGRHKVSSIVDNYDAGNSAASTEDVDPLDQDAEDDPSNVRQSTCTMCSICIDDFEEGEKLILLPRCRHSFHRDCIHPWVTERQGCCPLCKTNVLEKDTSTSVSGSSSSSSDRSESPINGEEERSVDTTVPSGDHDGSITASPSLASGTTDSTDIEAPDRRR